MVLVDPEIVLVDPVVVLVDPVTDLVTPQKDLTIEAIKTQLYENTPDFLSFLRRMEPTSKIMETSVLTDVQFTAVVELLMSA